MDRVTVYSGQIVRTVDSLQAQQNTMVGLAKDAETILGTSTLVDGFTCTPTGPASLNVILTAGTIYQQENIEASTWSSLSTDTHTIVKQGIQLDPVTFGITPPGTVGFSQVFLVEVQYADSDTGSTVLPYYNASNPAAPFSGPGNAGTAQNTLRKGIVASQVKASTAAATGTQVAPSADAGWTGLFLVTVANGATTITSGNITQVSTAPFLLANGKLPQIPTSVQNQVWSYETDTGTANNVVITPTPAATSYVAGQTWKIKLANAITAASTVDVSVLGTKSIVSASGTQLRANSGSVIEVTYDGTNFQLTSSGAGQAMSLVGVRTFTTPGSSTYTPSTGTRGVMVQVQGGGGGGAGSSSGGTGFVSLGGSGGAGGFAQKWITSSFSGQTITVGAGGSAGATGSQGTAGGTSSFGAIVTCTGGTAGSARQTVNAFPVGQSAVSGGTATGGDINIAGGIGQTGLLLSVNQAIVGLAGGSPLGVSGMQLAIDSNGNPGNGYGSGGTGGITYESNSAKTGGAGAQGVVIIWEYA